MHILKAVPRRSILTCALLAWILHVAVVPPTMAQDDWRIGNIVGLDEGTCIREGPGLEFRAHTRVPEDEWAVKVIGGPRSAGDRDWYDTSRREAGDPSGGTGWVDQSQTDVCPEEDPLPPGRDGPSPGGDDLLDRLRDWWRAQGAMVKWLVAIAVLAVLISSWRTLSATAFRLLGFLISGLILYWIADATREVWQPTWTGLLGPDAPDLALLIALMPVVSWLVTQLRNSGRR